MTDTAPLARDASEQRLRDLIAAAIPDPHMQITVKLAIIDYGLACEKAGIAAMADGLREVRRGSANDG